MVIAKFCMYKIVKSNDEKPLKSLNSISLETFNEIERWMTVIVKLSGHLQIGRSVVFIQCILKPIKSIKLVG